MGLAIANELASNGAEVTLVCGPVHIHGLHPAIKLVPVNTAKDMFNCCTSVFPEADGAILSAAVADFRPSTAASAKIKKGSQALTLLLEPTEDIALALGRMKKSTQFIVGFALETDDELENARKKLTDKNFDFIVLNSLKDEGAGFKHDTNKITIIGPNNKITDFKLKPKTEVARDIVDHLENLLSC